MYDKERANLAELSYRLFEKLVMKAFLDSSIELSYQTKIIFYCYLHKGISYRQIGIIFGDSNSQKNTMDTVLSRIIKKGFIQKFIYSASNETGYCITPKGITEGSKLVKDFFESNMSDEKLYSDYYDFTLDDIIEYLSNRCSACQPRYWQHYLASRDIYAYLLSGKISYSIFNYETEVPIEGSGRPASLYTRALFGLNLKYELRCDGMLTFKMSEDMPLFRYFIEVDNGSQSSAVLADKVKKYVENYLETSEFNDATSLMFCINTINEKPISKNKKRVSSTTDYYYGLLLVCVFDLLIAMGVEFRQNATINEVISFVKFINKKHSDSLYQIIRYFNTKTSFYKDHMPVEDLYHMYNENMLTRKNQISDEKLERHYSKYITRRALIHRSVIDVPGLHNAFLKGFSFYTVSNYDLDKTFPYINLQITAWFKNKMIRMLMKYKLLNDTDDIVYKNNLYYERSNILLRNFYQIKSRGKGIVIENVSDDLGGFYRVKNLLESDEVSFYMLRNILLICVCDKKSVNNLKKKFLETKQGKVLSKLCTDYIKDEFEVLFVTYEGMVNEQMFFTFSSIGEIIYKDKPLREDTKGCEFIF